MTRPIVPITIIAALLAVAIGQLAAHTSATPGDETPNHAGSPAHGLLNELIAHTKRHPDDAVTRLKLAFALVELGDAARARALFDEACAIDRALCKGALNPLAPSDSNRESDGGIAGGPYPTAGPDIIVGDLHQTFYWGRAQNITAFSIGTNSCNAGDEPVNWVNDTNQHPVIAQHMYRYKDGRFEMIGQSWVKHGFWALAHEICKSELGYGCSNPATPTKLGVGCSDPYSASLNGSYFHLGPKHEVNPTTGLFQYPHGDYPDNDPIGKRLQVHDDDLKPELNAGAIYYIEGHYIAPDVAAAGNDLTNASHRRVAVTETAPFVFNLGFVAGHPTVRRQPAIYAWAEHDPDVVIEEIDVPDDGRFIVAYRASENGDGTWHYEYAIHNFNSDRAAGVFSLKVDANVSVTNIEFRSVPWHSGAPYSNEPWIVKHENGMLTWSTTTHAENPNANALRWGTLYNFRFDADAPPADGHGALGLFKPAAGGPDELIVALAIPSPISSKTGDLTGDGTVGVPDLLVLLGQWGPCADCEDCIADLTQSCNVGVSDLLKLLANWG